MVYAAPPLRARPLLVAEACLAARGGLDGGEGIPCEERLEDDAAAGSDGELTELTSGMPLDPGSPASVVEALEGTRVGSYSVAASANIGRRVGVITTTTTVSFIIGGCHF